MVKLKYLHPTYVTTRLSNWADDGVIVKSARQKRDECGVITQKYCKKMLKNTNRQYNTDYNELGLIY